MRVGALKTAVKRRSSSSAGCGGVSSQRMWRRNCSWSVSSWDAPKRDASVEAGAPRRRVP